MISLPSVTLISVSTRNVEAAAKALEYSCMGIEFGAVKLVSHYAPENITTAKVQHEYVDIMPSIDDWNYYIVYELHKHVDTEYIILSHPDGFIVNPEKWQDRFLEYDYIGAVWDLPTAKAIQGGRDQALVRVGNSVSLRSRKLLELPTKINLEWKRFNNDTNEDAFISCHNRKIFEQHGCKFAPVEVAVHFAREQIVPEGEGIEPFAFHGYHVKGHPNFNYPKF